MSPTQEMTVMKNFALDTLTEIHDKHIAVLALNLRIMTPRTPNPKPQTPNHKPPKSGMKIKDLRIMTPRTPNPKPQTPNPPNQG